MATTRPTKKCIDCGKALEPKAQSEQWQVMHQHDACNDCFDYWAHENGHSDRGHETILLLAFNGQPLEPWMEAEIEEGGLRNCRVCQGRAEDPPVEAPEVDAEGAGTKGWHSHKGHGHALTQAARAACRRAQRKAVDG